MSTRNTKKAGFSVKIGAEVMALTSDGSGLSLHSTVSGDCYMRLQYGELDASRLDVDKLVRYASTEVPQIDTQKVDSPPESEQKADTPNVQVSTQEVDTKSGPATPEEVVPQEEDAANVVEGKGAGAAKKATKKKKGSTKRGATKEKSSSSKATKTKSKKNRTKSSKDNTSGGSK